MKKTENIMIFVVCFSFALYIVAELGLGGDKIQAMQSWQLLGTLLGLGAVAAVAGIVFALGISGTQASVIGSGVTVGNRVGEAAAVISWGAFYAALVLYGTNVIWQIDYVGPTFGAFFGIIATLVFIIDVIFRVMPGGR